MKFFKFVICFCLISQFSAIGQKSQIAIPRIDKMPDVPSPYNMRNWHQVSILYDSFIYDEKKNGQYLPVINYTSKGINYPELNQIKLHTYIGTQSPQNSEGINVLQSLVSAALNGIDIRTVYGRDRLNMAQDFYNKTNGENLYLNAPSTSTGGDWWYDVMPNIYFYQLYDLYPSFSTASDAQFKSVADKFYTATATMGGETAPWEIPNMNYRAWYFKTMTGNANGVKEPESAGTFGWLLYHAYKKSQDKKYLKAAEWSLEYLSSLTSNPSYELQLPYGAYVSAKMNAEIGTQYDVEKMVNWCFDRGPLRGWGSIVGKWGGMDISGLIGEANDGGNDYAFLMNGFQQAGALVPMVRYDKRFAKAIGKWTLNLANASRLFYTPFLPASLQDGSSWSNANDPKGVIAHEAIREKMNGLSPFATGDAIQGGWAATNFAIYGSSSVGYLGAIVENTNIDKILKLNLNATDFYNEASYPTFLFYNPFDTPKRISVANTSSGLDIYEMMSEDFILKGVTSDYNLVIPAKEAIIVVLTPANGNVTYDKNKMLVNDVVVDYNQTKNVYNYAPRIKALDASKVKVEKNDTTIIYCTAEDKDSDNLTYEWILDGQRIEGNKSNLELKAPNQIGTVEIKVIVKDEKEQKDSATIMIEVVNAINRAPQILHLTSESLITAVNGSILIMSDAIDPNGDPLTYTWTTSGGTIGSGKSNELWTAPNVDGVYKVTLKVADPSGLSAERSIDLLVKSKYQTGQMIAWYPFSGNTMDRSGNNLNGTSKGALLTTDFNGNANQAYYFNGGTQNIEVPSDPKLNVQNAISVGFWFKPIFGTDKELFLLSHGSWQNRWKVSLTPEKLVRWTVNSTAAVKDLDVKSPIASDSIYHAVATYDGSTMMLYMNGKLVSFMSQSGSIKTTTLPLLIGQMIPTDANYNFKGTMDDVRIYNYALNPNEVNSLYAGGVSKVKDLGVPYNDLQVYPNPAIDYLYLPIEMEIDRVKSATIVNEAGQISKEVEPRQLLENKINISSLAQGVYYIILHDAQGQQLGNIPFIKL